MAGAGSQAARARWGAGCALVLSAASFAAWGAAAAGATLVLGVVATAMQLAAGWRTRGAGIDQLRIYTVGVSSALPVCWCWG